MDQLPANGLSLYFENPYDPSPSLQQQIQQLIKQKGALRHISNQTLQAEIDLPVTEDSPPENGDDAPIGDDHETAQARQDRIWKAREEMLQKLAYAQNEILSALDFVSLLLSGGSTAAQLSMSPALKERVPTGSVEWKLVEKQQISMGSKTKLTKVSEGWKSQSFKRASDAFSQAASRLSTEAQRQSRYWDQIAGLKAEGWSISRLPSDSRAIGVHYGFPEAAPQFRSMSFALLQQDDSGDLQLDQRSFPENLVKTRVVILRDGVETGTSRISSVQTHHGTNIGKQILEVRDAIFEEELFHELSREARLIANQGARTQPEAVEAHIDSRTRIRVARIIPDEAQTASPSGPDDRLAEAIALNVRLLLLSEHGKLKERRSQPPSAMSLASQSIVEYALLRPILANMRHQAALAELCNMCEILQRTCAKAGLPFKFNTVGRAESQLVDDIQQLRQPVRSVLNTKLLDGQEITLEIETYLGSPVYGTIFRSKPLNFGFLEFQASSFDTVEEATDYLTHALTLDLISQTPEFEVLKPHSGEVMLKATEKSAATVNIHPQRLSLLVSDVEKVVYNWRPSGFQRVPSNGGEAAKSFREIVKSVNQKAP